MPHKSGKKILCKNFDGVKKYVSPDELTFRPSAYAVIIQKGKVLLSQQWDGYDFPGGGIIKGEQIEQALVREVWEETGFKIKPGKLLFAGTDFFVGTESGKCFHSILVYYSCLSLSGSLTSKNLVGDEKRYSSGPRWINLKDIKRIKFKNGVNSVDIINKAIAK